jgi:hypothetical protein
MHIIPGAWMLQPHSIPGAWMLQPHIIPGAWMLRLGNIHAHTQIFERKISNARKTAKKLTGE